jgi:hypothetical protein
MTLLLKNDCNSLCELSIFFMSNRNIIKSAKRNSGAQEVYKRNAYLEGEKKNIETNHQMS